MNFCVVGEAKKVISLVEAKKSIFFFQICPSEDFHVSLFRREDLHRNLLVNAYVSFAIEFLCVFREDFAGSLPTFLC